MPNDVSAAAREKLAKRDLTLDLARVAAVLLVVLVHLLFAGVVGPPSRPLVRCPGAQTSSVASAPPARAAGREREGGQPSQTQPPPAESVTNDTRPVVGLRETPAPKDQA